MCLSWLIEPFRACHATRIDQPLDLDAIDVISADGEDEDETTAETETEQETPEVTILPRRRSSLIPALLAHT